MWWLQHCAATLAQYTAQAVAAMLLLLIPLLPPMLLPLLLLLLFLLLSLHLLLLFLLLPLYHYHFFFFFFFVVFFFFSFFFLYLCYSICPVSVPHKHTFIILGYMRSCTFNAVVTALCCNPRTIHGPGCGCHVVVVIVVAAAVFAVAVVSLPLILLVFLLQHLFRFSAPQAYFHYTGTHEKLRIQYGGYSIVLQPLHNTRRGL